MSKNSEPRAESNSGAGLRRPGPWIAFVAAAGVAGFLAWQNLSLSEELEGRRELDAAAQIETAGLRNQLEAERLISRGQIESLRDAQRAADVAGFMIVPLASRLPDAPAAKAIAVWNPATQQGLLEASGLPALAADQDYQLWIIDPQSPNPVDGGVFQVDPASGGKRLVFQVAQSVKTPAGFEVRRGRKGGDAKAEGPLLLSSQ